jgi:hypothetical protein
VLAAEGGVAWCKGPAFTLPLGQLSTGTYTECGSGEHGWLLGSNDGHGHVLAGARDRGHNMQRPRPRVMTAESTGAVNFSTSSAAAVSAFLPRLVRGLEALLEASLLGIWMALATDAITQGATDPISSAAERIDEVLSWHRACSPARQSSSLLPCSGLDRTNCFDDGSCCPRVNGRVYPPEKTRRFVRKG